MPFNFWERWPWTSFENLNLDWLMKATKQAVTTAETAADSVGQFDARITANTEAIEQLGIDVETISSVARVFVNSQLEARYRGNLITGAELVSMLRTHGDLPFVEYNGEVYMLDTASAAGDLRFSMGHTIAGFDNLVIRHIMIPAQSSNAAYSITNVSAGGSSDGNVFAVKISPNPTTGEGYICDHTYAEIYSQMQSGLVPVLLVATGGNAAFEVCGMGRTDTATISGQSVACIRFADPHWMTDGSYNGVAIWTIYADNSVGRENVSKTYVTLDGFFANAVTVTPQTFTAAEKAIAKDNIGIVDLPAVTAADNGKILGVVNGAWTVTPPANALVIDFNNPYANAYNEAKAAMQGNREVYLSIPNSTSSPTQCSYLRANAWDDTYIVFGGFTSAYLPGEYFLFTYAHITDGISNWFKWTTPFYYNPVLLKHLAPPYDNTATYSVGDYCTYGDDASQTSSVYRCTTAIQTAEEWNSAHWTAVNVMDEVASTSLPDTTSASANDFLCLNAQKQPVWKTVPAAESNSFGGGA